MTRSCLRKTSPLLVRSACCITGITGLDKPQPSWKENSPISNASLAGAPPTRSPKGTIHPPERPRSYPSVRPSNRVWRTMPTEPIRWPFYKDCNDGRLPVIFAFFFVDLGHGTAIYEGLSKLFVKLGHRQKHKSRVDVNLFYMGMGFVIEGA